jgi:hypothetical protein
MYDQKLQERFLNKVVRSEHGCWLWTGHRLPKGYGVFRVGDKIHRAHRVAYELFKGEIPEGLHVTHSCDNPSCVNPDHLFAKTNADNVQESFDKLRSSNVGILHPGHKLTEDDVLQILGSSDEFEVLADRFGVTKENIYRIKTRRSWSHMNQ